MFEALLLRLSDALARYVAGARGREGSALWQEVQQARADGRVLLARIRGAADNEHTRRVLSGDVIGWYGDFELRLHDLAPELFEEFRSEGMLVGTRTYDETGVEISREDVPVDLQALKSLVREDLRTLRKINRRIVWGF